MSTVGQRDVDFATPVAFAGTYGPIAALQFGETTGPDVVLVPGFTGSKEDFGPLLEPLAAAGYRATAIDLPGQHDSPGPVAADGYLPGALAAEVAAVVANLRSPVHLVGHSFGGLVCRALVIDRPALVRDLVLMSSGPAALGGVRRDRIELMRPLLPELGMPGLWTAMQTLAASEAGYAAPPPDVADFLERRFLAGSPDMLLGMGTALITEPDRVDLLRSALDAAMLRCLVVHGVDDDAWPPATQAEMARRLGADYVVVPGAAHSPAVENPPATAEVLVGFWRGASR